ncbi:hypothetical protein CJD38_17495 [Stenotrophobium rhamnosiphilum]|uniref:Uncharacterized protein n=1 Tax=Stenotrophobium rhamnosiphilum TaxID=2029166 RepID=A0A2T5MBL9_9GAMM|nr:hypothetical protein CJD38_17495 [Stenotrophobium rhamnosiphilum]
MPGFIINRNAQPNGDHEVHNVSTGCSFMPSAESQINLGVYSACHEAVSNAKQQWPSHRINGCYYCCYACHTS